MFTEQPKDNYKVGTSKIRKQNTNTKKSKQSNLYHLDNNKNSVSAITQIIIPRTIRKYT